MMFIDEASRKRGERDRMQLRIGGDSITEEVGLDRTVWCFTHGSVKSSQAAVAEKYEVGPCWNVAALSAEYLWPVY